MSTIVVGAGAIGLSCAYELAELGEAVQVVDAAQLGAAASAGNAGWVTPFLSSPRAAPGAFGDAVRSLLTADGPLRMHPHIDPGFVSWSLRFLRASSRARHDRAVSALHDLASRAHDAFDSLHSRGVEFELYREGLGVVFKQRENLESYEQAVRRMRRFGYVGDVAVYRGAEIQQFDPAINSRVEGVMHLESERHVRPESLVRGLADAIRAQGSTIREHDAVSQIKPGDAGGWRVSLASGVELTSDRLVVAAGFATRRLLAPLGVKVPLEAAKGVSLTARGKGTVPKHPLKLYENMVACSPFDQSVRLSGTFDVGARGSEINQKRLAMVVQQGVSYLENWQPTDVELQWAGHRPTSADDLPIIGPVPGHDGLYLATGHGTLGITLGPLTGALAAKEVVGSEEQSVLAPFRLTRF
ncbi:NAD(P)/FAD-dependent oxidoreductase [Glaciibacter sp. 2TAF33]|uniref:NAD(P)/FAD-dependent oxidoreductase n=1 Tax=Glaciibacter sp. 2TAF33 TaxID=3233015 RepID=UPI003F92E488